MNELNLLTAQTVSKLFDHNKKQKHVVKAQHSPLAKYHLSIKKLFVLQILELVPNRPTEGTPSSLKTSRLVAALTHLHEELPLLHRGFASFAAFLDHPATHQTAEHTAVTAHAAPPSQTLHFDATYTANSTVFKSYQIGHVITHNAFHEV